MEQQKTHKPAIQREQNATAPTDAAFSFTDQRLQSSELLTNSQLANESPQARQLRSIQRMANRHVGPAASSRAGVIQRAINPGAQVNDYVKNNLKATDNVGQITEITETEYKVRMLHDGSIETVRKLNLFWESIAAPPTVAAPVDADAGGTTDDEADTTATTATATPAAVAPPPAAFTTVNYVQNFDTKHVAAALNTKIAVARGSARPARVTINTVFRKAFIEAAVLAYANAHHADPSFLDAMGEGSLVGNISDLTYGTDIELANRDKRKWKRMTAENPFVRFSRYKVKFKVNPTTRTVSLAHLDEDFFA